MEQENFLCHHGVKGMKWGRRKDRRKSSNTSYDRAVGFKANEAARAYYKSQKSLSSKTRKKAATKTATLQKGLTKREINAGRFSVALSKKVNAGANAGILGAFAGKLASAAATAAGAATLPAILAGVGGLSAVGAISYAASRGPYYSKQTKKYGKKLNANTNN